MAGSIYAGVEFVRGGVYKEEDLYVTLQKIVSFITSFLNQIELTEMYC